MSKHFRPWIIDEPMFLPAKVQDFVGADHLAPEPGDGIHQSIDLKQITGTYGSERGHPPFNPVMMTVLLIYAYCCGIHSSRKIAKACLERVDFMSIVGLDRPDFRTIAEFRKRHLKALSDLFVQVLLLCEKAGLVKLGHVACDGTKMKANALKHKAMSYGRMEERIKELEADVAEWHRLVDVADAEEDRDKTGEEMPDWVIDKQRRIEANDHAVDMATGQAAVAGDGEAAAAQKPTRVEAMRAKIKAGGRQSPYRLRKQVVEPVFGQIKEAGGFRQFLLRGIENVSGEWAMKAAAHNILKLADKILNPAGEVLKPARRRTLSTGSQMAQAMP
jgi:transposase